MKLAEALQLRADLQVRLSQMPQRLRNNATMQEGNTPTENPTRLLDELNAILLQLEQLINRINLTNCATKNANGVTITELIGKRDCLRRKAEVMRNFLNAASETVPRHTKTEIRIFPTVNVEQLRLTCDEISKQVRKIDIQIQELNWTTELI